MMIRRDSAAMMRAHTTQSSESGRSTIKDLVALFRELLNIFDRAGAAAQRYEELRAQSDEELAAQGLMRSDLPRKAFEDTAG